MGSYPIVTMTEKYWRTKIKESCEGVGTYKEEYGEAINTVSWTLAERDRCLKEYTDSHYDDEKERHTMLRQIRGLNNDIFRQLGDLGLTPAGLKKLNEAAMKNEEKGSNLEKALAKLGGA